MRELIRGTSILSVLVLAAAVVWMGGCGKKAKTSSENAPAASSTESAPAAAPSSPEAASRPAAPDFALKDLDGHAVHLSDLKGKVVVLDFWATWCPPCCQEIPHFIDLQGQLGSQGLQVVGISLDEGGVGVVRPFAQQNRINYVMLVGGQSVTDLYGGIQAIPTTFVIDKQGRIVKRLIGYNDESVFQDLIKGLLQES